MEENKVLATVNGKDITQQDVYVFLNQLGSQAAQFNTPDGIKQIATELVNQQLIYLDAMEKGLDKEENFKKQVEKATEDILKKYAIDNLLMDITTTEDEIVKFYNDYQEYFRTPEAMRASHILVDGEEEANKIHKEIEDGLAFEEAAKKYSKCPSKERGGDLGEFTRGKMVPEFEEAAFALEEGKISEPVKTQFGYHLIKVVQKKEAGISALEDVKGQIKKQVLGLKQQEVYLNKAEELKDKFEVKTYF